MVIHRLIETFKELYDGGGEYRVYFAPGRVNLIGEHTDYNGGHVFPCALTIGTYAVVRRREDRTLCFYSMNFEQMGVVETSLDELTPCEAAGWTNYPKGVLWAFGERGIEIPSGMDILIYGDIPNGSGLSSSASLEVLMGLAVNEIFDLDVSMTELALIGQFAENHYNGCSCGIMDQFASAMGKKGHAILLDTNTLQYEYAPIQLGNVSIIITNSKVKHSLVDSAYNDRRRECELALRALQEAADIQTLGELTIEEFEANKTVIKDPLQRARARHAVYENQRTIAAAAALKANDIKRFGELMNASHCSLRDDYDVSCEEIDFLVESAWKIPGVLGSRMTGGGFGGCTVSLVKEDAVEEFLKTLGSAYKNIFGLDAEFYQVEIGDGAHRIL